MQVAAALDCFLCGKPGRLLRSQLRDRIFDAPGDWSHRGCAACGLVWLDPQPHPSSLSDLYEQYFPDVQVADPPISSLRAQVRPLVLRTYGYDLPGAEPRLLARMIARSALVADMIAGDVMYLRARPGGEVLDVGCGTASVLGNLQALGWTVTGIELDPQVAAAAAERLGRPVLTGSIDDVQLDDDRYDAILLSHVIEHLPDPLASLAKCARALKRGGNLVILTPNTRSFGRRVFSENWLNWDPPRHLYMFDEKSLRVLAERAGLRPIAQRTLARKARWAWRASRMIQRSVRPTDELAPAQTGEALAAILFQLGEHSAARWAPVGEELLLTATKGATGEPSGRAAASG
jgi:2-polyprenyl-3-methyl-5-hydroxy-6-metoxy-1,4-benzoquinol methylase